MTSTQLAILAGILCVFRGIVTFSPEVKFPRTKKEKLLEWIDPIIVAAVIALFLITFVMRTFWIPSGSMKPTLTVHDYILVNKLVYRLHPPQRKDVIVFKPPLRDEKKDYIKRIIGLGGESLQVADGKVFINKTPLEEPYINEKPDYTFGPVKIPQESYFVMGDNRNDSDDSHIWGFLPKKNIEGKAILIFWPPPRIHLLK